MGLRVGIIGAGKMGLSHFSVVNAMRDAGVVAVCDTSRYVLSVLNKYVGVETFTSPEEMIERAGLDAVFIATPPMEPSTAAFRSHKPVDSMTCARKRVPAR